ncbi:hypothetical protein HQ865_04500 [Mucilaginibacter mali]|uniref:LTXXQ motif family protein n=1 Tax=Mucilaginibacter mali TaxID=2740462 RepID=A0A7D4UKX8_9SPHI|nr:hypothetical protein [Mucilaginibacter mali]QKJ29041.1 hypothetical protein HQ865_04500 [Mucilaginibacter mali]
MKKLMMLLFLLAGFSFAGNAQTAKKPAAAKLPKALVQQLNLTADQQGKIEAIVKTKAAKLDSLTALGDKLDKKSLRQGKKAVNDDAITKVNNVLNADQQKIYADYRAAHQQKAKAKKEGAEPTPPAN